MAENDLDPSAHPLVAALHAVLGDVEKAVADPNAETMVHGARKAMKAYRALLRLIDTPDARAARRQAAEAARGLASARDRVAARDALAALDEARLVDSALAEAARAVIGNDRAAAPGESATHRARLAAFLGDARARLALGLADQAAAADIPAGLARTYRRARKGGFETQEAMHETRKNVVAHRYQMTFFSEGYGGRGEKRARRAQKLRDILGACHDMETLRALLVKAEAAAPEPAAGAAPEGLTEADRLALDAAMATFQSQALKEALAAHHALFRRRARVFARKLRKAARRS